MGLYLRWDSYLSFVLEALDMCCYCVAPGIRKLHLVRLKLKRNEAASQPCGTEETRKLWTPQHSPGSSEQSVRLNIMPPPPISSCSLISESTHHAFSHYRQQEAGFLHLATATRFLVPACGTVLLPEMAGDISILSNNSPTCHCAGLCVLSQATLLPYCFPQL